jgi:hypothetical protein
MDRHKIQVYVDRELYDSLVTAAKTENLSISRYAERLLAEKSRVLTPDSKLENFEAILEAHLSPIKEAIARLVNQSESEIAAAVVNQSESPSPVNQSESPDTFLHHFYAVVLLVDGKIEKFWDGKHFFVNPLHAKIYKKPPAARIMETLEAKARGEGGVAKWNDLFNLIKLMGYPHGFGRHKTPDVEQHWIKENRSI